MAGSQPVLGLGRYWAFHSCYLRYQGFTPMPSIPAARKRTQAKNVFSKMEPKKLKNIFPSLRRFLGGTRPRENEKLWPLSESLSSSSSSLFLPSPPMQRINQFGLAWKCIFALPWVRWLCLTRGSVSHKVLSSSRARAFLNQARLEPWSFEFAL